MKCDQRYPARLEEVPTYLPRCGRVELGQLNGFRKRRHSGSKMTDLRNILTFRSCGIHIDSES